MRLLAEDLAGGMSLQMQVSKLSTELENAKLKLLSVQRNYDNLSSAHQRALADLDDLTGVEVALDCGEPHGEQRCFSLAQGPHGPFIDDQCAPFAGSDGDVSPSRGAFDF